MNTQAAIAFVRSKGSLDATCFRVAQAEQFGMTAKEAAIRDALTFLALRQRDDGSWEEEDHVAELTPPWATPGDLAARLYLTANCGFWLAAPLQSLCMKYHLCKTYLSVYRATGLLT